MFGYSGMRRLIGAVAAVFIIVTSGATHAAPIVINFDTVDTSGGAVSGAPVAAYLGGYGITLSAVTPGVSLYIQPYPPHIGTLSAPNMFGGVGLATLFTYRMDFSTPLNSISLTRPGINATSTMSAWTMTAYSATNSVLGSFGQNLIGPNTPAQTFSLLAAGIDHVVFTDNAFAFAGNNFKFDNLTIDPVPEPNAIALLGMALLSLFGFALMRRSAGA